MVWEVPYSRLESFFLRFFTFPLSRRITSCSNTDPSMVTEPNCVPSILGFIFTSPLAALPTTALPEPWAYCSATCRPHRQPAPDPPCSGREPPGADRRGGSAPPAYLPVLLPPPGGWGSRETWVGPPPSAFSPVMSSVPSGAPPCTRKGRA